VRSKDENYFWHGRFWRYVPLVFWCGVIFFLSTDNGSVSNTGSIVRQILRFFLPSTPEETLAVYHIFVRKLAHFTEYAILAFWASRAFIRSRKELLSIIWFLWAFGIVMLVAIIDEFNQSFNSNRTGSIGDVLLDCFGGMSLIIGYLTFRFLSKKLK
jgi:VanZ family protein